MRVSVTTPPYAGAPGPRTPRPARARRPFAPGHALAGNAGGGDERRTSGRSTRARRRGSRSAARAAHPRAPRQDPSACLQGGDRAREVGARVSGSPRPGAGIRPATPPDPAQRRGLPSGRVSTMRVISVAGDGDRNRRSRNASAPRDRSEQRAIGEHDLAVSRRGVALGSDRRGPAKPERQRGFRRPRSTPDRAGGGSQAEACAVVRLSATTLWARASCERARPPREPFADRPPPPKGFARGATCGAPRAKQRDRRPLRSRDSIAWTLRFRERADERAHRRGPVPASPGGSPARTRTTTAAARGR